MKKKLPYYSMSYTQKHKKIIHLFCFRWFHLLALLQPLYREDLLNGLEQYSIQGQKCFCCLHKAKKICYSILFDCWYCIFGLPWEL